MNLFSFVKYLSKVHNPIDLILRNELISNLQLELYSIIFPYFIIVVMSYDVSLQVLCFLLGFKNLNDQVLFILCQSEQRGQYITPFIK